MNPGFDAPKPEINVYYVKNAVPSGILTEVTLGIEEEGLPYHLYDMDGKVSDKSARHLAYKAAQISRLGTGIGMDDKNIVMHFNKLKEDEPLFEIPVNSDEEQLRAIGANAARIVKRMPFKPLD